MKNDASQIPIMRSQRMMFGWTVVIVASAIGFSCSTSSQPPVEATPSAQVAQMPEPPQLPMLPPKLIEVQEAVKRVFKEAAEIDTGRNPSFISGDFNGDASEDIAVVVKPVPGRIDEMNEEFPAWILRDLLPASESQHLPLRVEENEVLLAVIHGYGANDWRDPQATQTHLLKNAVGSAMQTQSGKELIGANQGKAMPRFHGDLIREVLRGSSGYLYYAGATYAWYDPWNFKGEPERRLVHSRRAN